VALHVEGGRLVVPGVSPEHEELLAAELENLARYAESLEKAGVEIAVTTFFVFDLRAEYGRRAGEEIAGVELVERLLEQSRMKGTLPRVSFCLDDLEDAKFIAEPVAPEVVPLLGRRPDGLVQVLVVDARGRLEKRLHSEVQSSPSSASVVALVEAAGVADLAADDPAEGDGPSSPVVEDAFTEAGRVLASVEPPGSGLGLAPSPSHAATTRMLATSIRRGRLRWLIWNLRVSLGSTSLLWVSTIRNHFSGLFFRWLF